MIWFVLLPLVPILCAVSTEGTRYRPVEREVCSAEIAQALARYSVARTCQIGLTLLFLASAVATVVSKENDRLLLIGVAVVGVAVTWWFRRETYLSCVALGICDPSATLKQIKQQAKAE